MADLEFAGQLRQDVAPLVGEYDALPQLIQFVSIVAPIVVEYLLATQLVHTTEPVAAL
jgi:hypothetical protein